MNHESSYQISCLNDNIHQSVMIEEWWMKGGFVYFMDINKNELNLILITAINRQFGNQEPENIYSKRKKQKQTDALHSIGFNWLKFKWNARENHETFVQQLCEK